MVGLSALRGGHGWSCWQVFVLGSPTSLSPSESLWKAVRYVIGNGGSCLLVLISALLPACCTAKALGFIVELGAPIHTLVFKGCARNGGFLVNWGKPSSATLHSKVLHDTRD